MNRVTGGRSQIPKIQSLNTSLFTSQPYKVRIEGKVE